jgi:hypothetical protein
VEVAVIADGDRMSAQVRATSVGTLADLQPFIGEVFEQASNVPKLAREGTGLGLTLIRAPSSGPRGFCNLHKTHAGRAG